MQEDGGAMPLFRGPMGWRRPLGRRQILRLGIAGGAGWLAGGTSRPGAADDEATRDFRIGTGPTTSNYFIIGGIIANAISNPPGSRPCDRGGSCGVPGLVAVAQTTQGSVQNVDLVDSAAMDSGLCQSDVAYWAYSGTGMYGNRKPSDGLRAIANLYQENLHVIVRADSTINSIADLAGKRVSLGQRGSGTRATAALVLGAYGLGESKVIGQQLPVATACERLQDRSIDGLFVVGGPPIPTIADLAQSVELRLLPVDRAKADDLQQKYPFLTVGFIQGGTYERSPTVVTVGVGTYWLVLADLDETLAYGIATALWHKSTRKQLDEAGALGRRIRLENALVALPIPLHGGAQRYYAEARAQGTLSGPSSN